MVKPRGLAALTMALSQGWSAGMNSKPQVPETSIGSAVNGCRIGGRVPDRPGTLLASRSPSSWTNAIGCGKVDFSMAR